MVEEDWAISKADWKNLKIGMEHRPGSSSQPVHWSRTIVMMTRKALEEPELPASHQATGKSRPYD